LGAVVGLHLLARNPQRIERAILIGAFAAAPPRWLIRVQGWILSILLSTGWGKRLFTRTLHLPAEILPRNVQKSIYAKNLLLTRDLDRAEKAPVW
jgi:pimeloyl-ACP methyl ester carboxylesterase